MDENSRIDWLQDQIRQLTVRRLGFEDLVELVIMRDLLNAVAQEVPADRLPWSGAEAEDQMLSFIESLIGDFGVTAPLGDRIALAIRMTDSVRRHRRSLKVMRALEQWLDGLEGDDDDEILQPVLELLRRELGIRKE